MTEEVAERQIELMHDIVGDYHDPGCATSSAICSGGVAHAYTIISLRSGRAVDHRRR